MPKASAAEIFKILDELEPVLTKYPPEHVYIACLTIAFSLVKPNLTAVELQAGVFEASTWMSDYINRNDLSVQSFPSE